MDKTEDKTVYVRLKPDQVQMLESLCRQDVRDQTGMLRFLVVQEYVRRNGATAAPTVAEKAEA